MHITLTAKADTARLARRLSVLALLFTLIIGGFRLASFVPYATYPVEGQAEISAITSLLDHVEDGASVKASGRLLPNLAAREDVYPLSSDADADYVVLDLRDEWMLPAEEDFDIEHYEEQGYEVVASRDGVCAVMKKK